MLRTRLWFLTRLVNFLTYQNVPKAILWFSQLLAKQQTLMQTTQETGSVTQNANRLKQIILQRLLGEILKAKGDAPPKKSGIITFV
jgi:hypothetical protein